MNFSSEMQVKVLICFTFTICWYRVSLRFLTIVTVGVLAAPVIQRTILLPEEVRQTLLLELIIPRPMVILIQDF